MRVVRFRWEDHKNRIIVSCSCGYSEYQDIQFKHELYYSICLPTTTIFLNFSKLFTRSIWTNLCTWGHGEWCIWACHCKSTIWFEKLLSKNDCYEINSRAGEPLQSNIISTNHQIQHKISRKTFREIIGTNISICHTNASNLIWIFFWS